MTKFWPGAEDEPSRPKTTLPGWGLVAVRGLILGVLVFGGLALLLLLRLIERPLFGLKRPMTPALTQGVCRLAFVIMGIGYRVEGRPMRQKGAIVANHVSWLDIFALNAPQRIYFVSKSEVANWPAIGWLARATGTVFIQRKGSEALAQKNLFEARLRAGHKLLFFPEGTSTDGLRVLPFKSTLFAAFFADGLDRILWVQPVSLRYVAPKGADPRFYGWWGDMDFGSHLLQTLARFRQGRVVVRFGDPVRVSDFANRKALAEHCENVVRAGTATRSD
jgi:1-acyl-sn-glycerol-3-phosphate acyltransferase